MVATEHPSNRLSDGEARDFATAIGLFKQAIRMEIAWGRKHNMPDEGDILARQLVIADAALAAYREAEEEAFRLMADRVEAALRDRYKVYEYEDLIVALRERDFSRMAV